MWEPALQNQPGAGAVMDKEKQQVDTQVDSGFLSGSNLFSSELSIGLEDEEQRIVDLKVAPEPKKASESGLDFGLPDGINQLSLKEKEETVLNVLDSGTFNVTNELDSSELNTDAVKRAATSVEVTVNNPENSKPEPWELYYTQDDDGDTQLHIAIIQELAEATFFLISIAPDPCLLNILNDNCQSPLHLAVLTRQPRTVRRLILAGADPTTRDFKGNTALHLACASGDLRCARALCEVVSTAEQSLIGLHKRLPPLPQDLEIRNYTGEHCIHIAAKKGHIDIFRYLAHLGANLEAREGLAGNTALHIAIEKQRLELAMVMLREFKFNLDTCNYGRETAHLFALRNKETQIAEELVKRGATAAQLHDDSESESEDEEYDSEAYIKTLARLGITVKPAAVATA